MRRILPTITLVIAGFAGTAAAQNWTGGGAAGAWSDPANWDTGVPTGADPVIINSTGTPSDPVLDVFLDVSGASGDPTIGSGGGSGILDINAGGTLSAGGKWTRLGDGGGTGILNVNTGGAFTSTSNVQIMSGSSQLNVNGGTVTAGGIDGNGVSGRLFTLSSGTINTGEVRSGAYFDVSGGTLNSSGNIMIDAGGVTASISGGSIDVDGELWFASGTGNSASMSITGGSIDANSWVTVGRNGGTGVLNQTAGNFDVATGFSDRTYALGTNGGNGTVNQSGGTTSASRLLVGEGAGGTTGVYNLSGGSLTLGADSHRIGYNNDAAGELNVSGTAVLSASGTTYIGMEATATGELNVEGSGATINLADIALGLDGSLTDTGAVGTIGFVADAGGVSTIGAADVNLTSPDGDFLTVDLSAYLGPWVDLLLIDGTSLAGEFTGLAQNSLVTLDGNSNPYYVDYSDGGNVWLRTAVPEPTASLLGGLGLLVLLRRRR